MRNFVQRQKREVPSAAGNRAAAFVIAAKNSNTLPCAGRRFLSQRERPSHFDGALKVRFQSRLEIAMCFVCKNLTILDWCFVYRLEFGRDEHGLTGCFLWRLGDAREQGMIFGEEKTNCCGDQPRVAGRMGARGSQNGAAIRRGAWRRS